MAELGYERNWEQCRQKIKNLKTDYKKIKDNNRQTGKGRKEWKHFDLLDKIMRKRAAIQPPTIFESMQGSSGSSTNDVSIGQQNGDMTPGDEVERSLFDDDLTQVDYPTQLEDGLTQVDDDQTQVSDNDLTQADSLLMQDAANPTQVNDSPHGSNDLRKPDESLDTQSDSTQPKSKITVTTKKSKLSKKGAAMEKVVGGIVDKFMVQQQEAEIRFFSFEEKMRKEERQHEERMMMGMVQSSSMLVAPSPHTYYYNSPHVHYQQQTEGMPPDERPEFDY